MAQGESSKDHVRDLAAVSDGKIAFRRLADINGVTHLPGTDCISKFMKRAVAAVTRKASRHGLLVGHRRHSN
ncbi:MAG: hypothetical protein WB760_26610, partial [Xanthobacteraceae bacterium]